VSIKITSITTLLAASAAAITIAAAPSAAAAPPSNCSVSGPDTECVTPGNAQINDALPPDFESQYPDFSLFGFGHDVAGRR
jgi:hypothetical protein